MSGATSTLPIVSVVICTRDRAGVVRSMLESLCRQTLPQRAFEVVLVDDGSTDDTREVVRAFEPRLPLRYSHQRSAGVGSARNHGVFLARGAILLFIDDETAEPTLLEEHLATHRRYPEPRLAVLGRTRLDASIAGDPLMRFVTEVGFVLGPPHLESGEVLDPRFFSTRRSSCKRSFLLERGVFNPLFRSGCEDAELAYRLSSQRFEVVYDPRAVSTTVRAVSVDEFCERQYREGEACVLLSRLHPGAAVEPWAKVAGAAEAWRAVAPAYDGMLRSARELDRIVRMRGEERLPVGDLEVALLHRSYWAAFRASRTKGIAEAASEAAAGAAPREATA